MMTVLLYDQVDLEKKKQLSNEHNQFLKYPNQLGIVVPVGFLSGIP